MKLFLRNKSLSLFLLLTLICISNISAQSIVCNKDTALYVTFGAGNGRDVDMPPLRQYKKVNSTCPEDGYYSFVSYTGGDCFGYKWIVVPQDKTPGDVNGKMMLVNASPIPADFYITTVRGLKPNAIYEISSWILNVCNKTEGCNPVYPDIEVTVATSNGITLTKFKTGQIPPSTPPIWKRYARSFTTPAIFGDVIVKFSDRTYGGCGNDFAIDDILITLCDTLKTEPPKIETPPIVKKDPVVKPKPVVTPVITPVVKTPPPAQEDTPTYILNSNTKVIPAPVQLKDTSFNIKLIPRVLQVRSNPVVKQIITDSCEIKIELYDNGIIDGDTVSIYHNNELAIANAAISYKPVTISIKVDALHPHHEIIMTANNLGSIPPNTSLMIVTAKDKRYEVFISSDDKKNARVLIDLRK